MSVNSEFVEAKGAYAVPRFDQKTIVIKVPNEDIGKIEGGADWTESVVVTAGMFGIVTGKVDGNETYEETLARELFEEQQLIKTPDVFTNGLPTAKIKQERPNKKLLFTVHGHQFPLTPDDISFLKEKTAIDEIEDSQLAYYLLDSKQLLRPSVHAILTLFLSYLEMKGSYGTK